MLKLFNFSGVSNAKLLNILKINKVYESKLIDNNFISKILTLNIFNIEEANAAINNNIQVTKKLEIVQDYFNSNKLTNIINVVNELKLKELKLVSYDRHKQHILYSKNIKSLRKLILADICIDINIENKKFDFNNNSSLLSLTLYSCRINKCYNFNSFIKLLNSSLPNLKSLCLSSIDFNNNIETETGSYKTIFDDIYIHKLSNVNFEKYRTECANLDLKQLKHLSLHNIKIPFINVENLTNLEQLNLYNNHLYYIYNLSKLTNLLVLKINFNCVYKLDLKNLSKLVKLETKLNYMSELTNLNDLVNLEYLDASSNELKTQSNGQLYDMSNLKNLVKLNLKRNLLPGIILNDLVKLKSLNLRKNEISGLNLNSLTNLIDLNISGNLIWGIDLSNLNKIQNLDTSDNPFPNVKDLNKLTNLINLNMSENSIQNIDLSNLNKIRNLDLSYNSISELNLKKLNNIVDLNIQGNYIKKLIVNRSRKINIYYEYDDVNYITTSKLKKLSNKVFVLDFKNRNYINISGITILDSGEMTTEEKMNKTFIKFK